MLHNQNNQASWTSHKRALFIAPLSAFPIILVFGIIRDSSINDFRSIQAFLGLALFPALEAFSITVGYYLFEVTIFGIVLMGAPKLLSSFGRTILVGLISAEMLLWIHFYGSTHWQLDDRISFSSLFAVCGLATGLVFHRLSHVASTR